MRIQKSTAALLLVVCTTIGLACSADRIIWMPNDDSADPLYRFIANEKAGYIDRSGKIVVPPTLDVRKTGTVSDSKVSFFAKEVTPDARRLRAPAVHNG